MMHLRIATRILLAVGTTALLLAASLAGLAMGQMMVQPEQDLRGFHMNGRVLGIEARQVSQRSYISDQNLGGLAVTADGSCDAVCVDDSCIPIPADQLPPIEITDDFIIYPTRACLCENEDGSKRLEGEGEFFLPNIQTDQGTDGIYVKFVLDWPSLEPQCVQFTGTWEEGAPIGESGFLLTSLEGEVTFEPEPSIHVTGTIESELQAPGDSSPAVTGEGTLWVGLEEPYEMSFEGTLTAFTMQSVQAAMTLDQSWGFAGSATFTGAVCGGPGFLHVWEEGQDVYGFSGSAALTCNIEAGSLTPEGWPDALPQIPPQNITATAEAEVGEFCIECASEGQCAEKTYGVWASAALDLSLPEDLVEPGTINARFFISSTGILSATTNLVRCEETDQAAVVERTWRQGVTRSHLHEVDFAVRPTDLTIFAVEWLRGHPEVTLIDPQGAELNPASVAARDGLALTAGPKSVAFVVKDPQPGLWRVRLAGLSGDEAYTLTQFCLNQPPTISITSPSAPEDQPDNTGVYTIRWTASDLDDDAIVSLYYDRDGTGRDGRLIACCLSETDGTYAWDTSELGSGTYYVYGRIDDGKNPPVVSYSAGTVKVVDHMPPIAPSTPSVSLQSSEIEVSWQANAEDDVVGYRVYYGPKPGTYVGSYNATNMTRFRLPKARRYPRPPRGESATDVTRLHLPRVPSTRTAYIAVSAYDSSGNESPLSEEARLWFVYLPAIAR